LLINSKQAAKMNKRNARENRADLLDSFAENLREVAEDDASVFELPLTPYACISRCIPFLDLCFVCSRLKNYSSALFFKTLSTLSRFVSVFVVLRPVLVREGFTSGMGF